MAEQSPYLRLEELLRLKRGQRLTFDQARELIALHERVSADLSLTTELDAAQKAALQELVSRSFNEVYGALPFYRRPPFEFLRRFYQDTPKILYRYRAQLNLVIAVMLIAALAGAAAVLAGDETSPRLMLGPGLVQHFQETVASDESWALAADIPPPVRPVAGAAIILNNSIIAVMSFIVGLLLAYGTLVVVLKNGYMLGYIAALYTVTGAYTGTPELGWYFWAGVLPHGVLEIPAIALSATAGLALGASWMFPGRRTRSRALAETAREVFQLVLAAVILLVIAGLIEGFITPLGGELIVDRSLLTFGERLPVYLAKLLFSVALFGAFFLWLRGGWPRRARRRQFSKQSEAIQ
jgi:uncharacterized membrane protein SpoIIM required for sporulation